VRGGFLSPSCRIFASRVSATTAAEKLCASIACATASTLAALQPIDARIGVFPYPLKMRSIVRAVTPIRHRVGHQVLCKGLEWGERGSNGHKRVTPAKDKTGFFTGSVGGHAQRIKSDLKHGV
jgi:hypothetical protein